MSTAADIADVHNAESKLRLKPHLATQSLSFTVVGEGPLRVTLEELLTAETVETLRKLGILQ